MDEVKLSLLDIVGYQLFGGVRPEVCADIRAVLREAKAQTVYAAVFPFLQDELMSGFPDDYKSAQEDFFRNVIINTNNFQEHGELHELMERQGIPYVAIKGLSSAAYYPVPSLREMGDVDFLVYERDFERAKQAVLGIGFAVDHGDDDKGIHIAFKRDPMSIWEQHRSINGIPEGDVGKLIQREIDSTIETARMITLDGTACRVPDTFHHGLIILLHMISHMTSEGIGLRHLSDWAVFVNRLTDDEFYELFADKFKTFGVWKYAQIMTCVSEKYLGVGHKRWAENKEINDELLRGVIADIMSGGNFGKKDANRYREIKYISNRGERTVDNKNVIAQAFGTLNQKTYADYPWIEKRKFFWPIGWTAEGGRYVGLLIKGERKSKGTSEMLKEAARRKDIYSMMDLFEVDD